MDAEVEVKTEPADAVMAALPGVAWSIDTSQVLGKNATGTSFVFRGTYNTQQVAIKRVPVDEVEETKDNVLISELDHENVVKLLRVEESNLFKFFILELCAASLQGYFDQDYTGPMPSDVQVLYQLSRGLDYIHSKGLVYRKIKPENILISLTTPVVMKWADFGLTKLPTQVSESSGSNSQSSETFCWMSPEVLTNTNRNETCVYSKESAIFSAGCVYFYFLTRAHPFGKKSEVKKNILEGNPICAARFANGHFTMAVVVGMIAKDPADRITLAEVIDGFKPKPIPQQPIPTVVSPSVPRYITDADILTTISELKLGMNFGTVHAKVVLKPENKLLPISPFNMFFTMVLRDDTGEIIAKAFGEQFQRFHPLFEVGRKYAISRAILKLNKDGIRELSLVKATTVECL